MGLVAIPRSGKRLFEALNEHQKLTLRRGNRSPATVRLLYGGWPRSSPFAERKATIADGDTFFARWSRLHDMAPLICRNPHQFDAGLLVPEPVVRLAQTLGLIRTSQSRFAVVVQYVLQGGGLAGVLGTQKEDIKGLKEETGRLMEKNDGVLSVAVLRANGQYLVRVGDHPSHIQSNGAAGSAADRVEIPIYKGRMPWGKVQICFRSINSKGWAWWFTAPVRLILCLTLSTFLLSRLYLKRVLRHLDPSSVIPDRVRSTLDTLAEGVLIVDTNQRIVLANKAFADKCGRTRDELQGLQMAELQWTRCDQKEAAFPWQLAISENSAQIGALLTMQSTPHRRGTFVVNATPVLGSDGSPRGGHGHLRRRHLDRGEEPATRGDAAIVEDFVRGRAAEEQRVEVAGRPRSFDRLLNRRSLFDAFVGEWQSAAAQGSFLSCIMVYVDHFKNVNDEHGHTAGDEVLRQLSAALLEGVRQSDFVGRYGGEEFCLLLPRTSLRAAATIAEKLRLRIAEACIDRKVTASFGVSSTESGASHPQELLEEADLGMHLSKKLSATESRPGRPRPRARMKIARRKRLRVRARRRCTRVFPSRRSTL